MKVVFVVAVLSTALFADEDSKWSLNASLLHNFATEGVYAGGEVKDTDSGVYMDFEPNIEVGTGLGAGLQLRRSISESGSLYFGAEYNNDLPITKLEASYFDTLYPEDTVLRAVVLDAGLYGSVGPFGIYGGVNFTVPNFEDRADRPMIIDSSGGVGWSAGLEIRFNDKHAIAIEAKYLSIEANAEYDNVELDFGNGAFMKRSVLYRYNFGSVFE